MTSVSQPARPQPRILVFYCTNCQGSESGSLSDAIQSAAASVTTVHFTCARDVQPEHIVKGFRDGADGVLICGCLVRECPGSPDDLTVLRDLVRNQVILKSLGLETDRLREEWMVEGTTDSLREILAGFADQLRELGPARITGSDVPPLKADAGQA